MVAVLCPTFIPPLRMLDVIDFKLIHKERFALF